MVQATIAAEDAVRSYSTPLEGRLREVAEGLRIPGCTDNEAGLDVQERLEEVVSGCLEGEPHLQTCPVCMVRALDTRRLLS